MQRLTNLKRLYLRDVKTDFEDIVNNATKLNGLVELQVQAYVHSGGGYRCYEPNPPSIIQKIAFQMPQLQVFGISYCKVKDETISEFLKFTDNLREFHIHHCNFELTPGNIEAVISARNKSRNRIDPLVIYVDHIDDNLLEVSHS